MNRTCHCFFAFLILLQTQLYQQDTEYWRNPRSQGEWISSAYEIQVQVTKSSMQTSNDTIFLRVEWMARNLTKIPLKINWTKNLVHCGACSGEAGKTLLFSFSTGIQKSELQPGETSAPLWAEYQLSPCFIEGSGMSYIHWGQFDAIKNKFIYSVRLKPENPSQKREMREKASYIINMCHPVTNDWRDQSYYGRQGEWVTLSYRAKPEDAHMEQQCKIFIENSSYWIIATTMHVRVEWKIQNLSSEEKSYSWENKCLFLVAESVKSYRLSKNYIHLRSTEFSDSFQETSFIAPSNGKKADKIPPQGISPLLWTEYQFPLGAALPHDTDFRYNNYYKHPNIEINSLVLYIDKLLKEFNKTDLSQLIKEMGWGLISGKQPEPKYIIWLSPSNQTWQGQ